MSMGRASPADSAMVKILLKPKKDFINEGGKPGHLHTWYVTNCILLCLSVFWWSSLAIPLLCTVMQSSKTFRCFEPRSCELTLRFGSRSLPE